MIAASRAAGLAVLVLAFLAGCDTGPEQLTAVRGKVLYRGVPLSGGTIVFTPDPSRGGNGSLASAEIQPDGTYVLQSGDRAGAVPGWHRITVVAVTPPFQPGEAGFAAPQSLLPIRYRDPELSGLSRHVQAGEENTIDFNLE